MRPRTHPVAWPSFAWRDACGTVELAVAEAARGAGPGLALRPARVTALIASLFESIDGAEATPSLAASLASGSREWLVQQAAAGFRPRPDWVAATCHECHAIADLPVDFAALPLSSPDADFPVVTIETSLGVRYFDLPNGYDELALAQHGDTRAPDDEAPVRILAARCGLAPCAATDAETFTDDDLARIDAAMDAASAEPATAVSFACPECGVAATASLDPLSFAFPRVETVLHDVDRLAARYGWSEQSILALPLQRRRAYLDLIARQRSA